MLGSRGDGSLLSLSGKQRKHSIRKGRDHHGDQGGQHLLINNQQARRATAPTFAIRAVVSTLAQLTGLEAATASSTGTIAACTLGSAASAFTSRPAVSAAVLTTSTSFCAAASTAGSCAAAWIRPAAADAFCAPHPPTRRAKAVGQTPLHQRRAVKTVLHPPATCLPSLRKSG